jgi:hypothetical protein
VPEVRVLIYGCLLADPLVGAARTKSPACGEVAAGRRAPPASRPSSVAGGFWVRRGGQWWSPRGWGR